MIKYSEENLNMIHLTLGLACNMNCKYCYEKQSNHINSKCGSFTNNNPQIAIDYIKHLAEIRDKDCKPLKLMFWGGEPLLYFDTIKYIISELILDYNIDYKFITNGLNLTPEIVNICNMYNIGVGLSHDGPNTIMTRHVDILKSDYHLDLLHKINNLGINSVLSAYNCDYMSTINYIRTEFKLKPNIKVHFGWLHCDNNTPKELYNYDYEVYQNNLIKYLEFVKEDLLSGNITPELIDLLPHINRVFNPSDENIPICSQTRRNISIDLNGNVTACHPYGNLGYIGEDLSVLQKRYDKKYNKAFNFEECKNCEILQICKAGCPFETSCEGKKQVCKLKRIFYNTLKEFFSEKICIK